MLVADVPAILHTDIFPDAPMKLPWASKALITDLRPEGVAAVSTEATMPEVPVQPKPKKATNSYLYA